MRRTTLLCTYLSGTPFSRESLFLVCPVHPIITPSISYNLVLSIYCGRGTEAYQLCVDCVIESGKRTSEHPGTKYDWPGTACAKGPICVHEFYHRTGGSVRFNIRARVSQHWTPWSADRVFDIRSEPGTAREIVSTHTEL